MSSMTLKIESVIDSIKNTVCSYRLAYVCEVEDWSIKNDGFYLTSHLHKFLKCRKTVNSWGIRNKLIHYGSVNTLINKQGIQLSNYSNKVFLTWFHIAKDDERVKYIPELNSKVEYVHTSCQITKELLEYHGLKPSKIKVIPLGVDLKNFRPISSIEKNNLKKKLRIPSNRYVIGSFQKDGVGWGEGLIPKEVKGPDIFCSVVEKLVQTIPVHVVLTGPARGYVKKRLQQAGVSYTHVYLKEYLDVVKYYQILDLYLVTSRAEGGPKAVLESMACGVPLVSTKVGLVPDIVKNEEVLIANIDDTNDLIEKTRYVLTNKKKADTMRQQGLQTIQAYDWSLIAERYFELLYKPYVNS